MNPILKSFNKLNLAFRGFALTVMALAVSQVAWASEGAPAAGGHGHEAAMVFMWIAVILIAAKISGLLERFGQPVVLGELLIGVVLGNLVLIGVDVFEPLKHQPIIAFLAELGVVVLLFQIGLETSLHEMKKVGFNAFMVAILGVVVPFALGTIVVGPWLMPGLDLNAYLFIGATMTATSVGITARVFKDLHKLQTPEARIVLGAAVIDDVLGLIILAVVSVIVSTGNISVMEVGIITAKAVGFLVGSIGLGLLLAPFISHVFSRIHSGAGMKFTLAISLCLLLAYAAQLIGLAPIVGAFAAGLVLKPVHFKTFDHPTIVMQLRAALSGAESPVHEDVHKAISHHQEHHVDELIEPLGYFLVPIFFVMTGVNVRLETLFNGSILLVALGVTIAAILGKIVSGVLAGKGVSKAIVGWGMVPRGEVGLIFAMIGKSLGVVTDEVFSIIVIMVILTTLITPPMLGILLKKQKS